MNKTKKDYVDEIFKPNEQGISEWIHRDSLENTPLKLGNNGNSRNGILFGVKDYKWDTDRSKFKKIMKVRTIGYSNDYLYGADRPIRQDIKSYYRYRSCVVCGSNSDLIVDHKNDLYNDPRVLDTKTQTIDDFQTLCNHCNLQKRQVAIKTKKSGKRVGATTIPQIAIHGIDFISGDENYDPEDINAMVGTYWYDPIVFNKAIKNKYCKFMISHYK